MNLLNIPVEVFVDNLFPYLGWNDLLRIRRVSKTAKAFTSSYLQVHAERAPEIEINEDGRGFDEFLKTNIPTTKVFLNNVSGDAFYQQDEKNIDEFLMKYGQTIKYLRVKQFSFDCSSGKEWDFIDSLENLQSFEAEYFNFGIENNKPSLDVKPAMEENLVQDGENKRDWLDRVPKNFKQLTRLKIGQNKDDPTPDVKFRLSFCTNAFLKINGLEYVSFPSIWQCATSPVPAGGPVNPDQSMARCFLLLDLGIQNRAKKFPEKSNVKIIDFISFHDEMKDVTMQIDNFAFHILFKFWTNCIKYDVKFMNVSPFWFKHLLGNFRQPEMGLPFLSMINIHPCVLPMNMPNLERIEIRKTSISSVGPSWRQDRPDWPALKSLDITVDSKQDKCSQRAYGQPISFFSLDTKTLFHFFFQDIRRTTLTELRLNFIKEKESVAIPRTDVIASGCPNLKKLTIVNWPGTNKSLTKLWTSLPGLEEISLECCKDLGNVAFVGEDVQKPVFFKLKKLKKLSLKGLDQMPKITDTLLSLVIRHLKLTQFTLTSDRPVESVTPAGILCLLEGIFAGSIEKFPFRNWSMADVSFEEFTNMEAKFRSYNML